MIPASEHRNDRFLLVGIAVVLVAAMVSVALLGWFQERSAPTVARDASPPAFEVGAAEPLGDRVDTRSPAPSGIPDPQRMADARAAFGAREYATAAALYADELRSNPASAETAYMLGLAAWKSGDLESAIDAMRRTTILEPGSLRALVNLSRIHNARGEATAALEAAERALAIDATDSVALYQRARSLRNLGRVDEALAVLGECLGRNPAYGQALNLVGLIHLERGETALAVDAFDSAAALESEVAFVHRNLGLALERAGRAEEAVLAYRRAAELSSEPPVSSEPAPVPVAVAATAGAVERAPADPVESD